MRKSIKKILILFLLFATKFLSGFYTQSYYPDLSSTNDLSSITIYCVHENYIMPNTDHTNRGKFIMVSSLQGLLAKKRGSEYIAFTGTFAAEQWLYRMQKCGVRLDYRFDINSPQTAWNMLAFFKDKCVTNNRYIRYNVTNDSLNWACSLSGLYQAVLLDGALAAKGESYGLVLYRDVQASSEATEWENYTNHSQRNRKLLIDQPTDAAMGLYNGKMRLRDYSIAGNIWTFYDNDNGDPRNIYCEWADDDSPILGWGGGTEDAHVGEASRRSIHSIPSDYGINFSTLPLIKDKIPLKKLRVKYIKTMRDLTWEDNVKYVTFILSDGDNLGWQTQNYWFTSEDTRWWGSHNRGNFNMGWSICPSLTEIAPSVFESMFSDDASWRQKQTDGLTAGISGHGYMYLGTVGVSDSTVYGREVPGTQIISTNARRFNEWAKRYNFTSTCLMVTDLTQWNNYNFESYADFTERLVGFFGLTYSGAYKDAGGDVKWPTDKDGYSIPVKSCKYTIWDGFDTPASVSAGVNGAPSLPDGGNSSFFYVNSHPWSSGNPISKISNTIALFNTNIRTVRPDEFLMQMQLRLNQSQTIDRYLNKINAKLSELSGMKSGQSPAALNAFTTATNRYAIARANWGASQWQSAFTNGKRADEWTEIARLSFLKVTNNDVVVKIISIPEHRNALYGYFDNEIISGESTVAQYRFQVATNTNFSPLEEDVYSQIPVFVPANVNKTNYVRVKAQGKIWGDWGEWSWRRKLPPSSITSNIHYVDGINGSDLNDGLTWQTAFKTVPVGIGAKIPNKRGIVYVAAISNDYFPFSTRPVIDLNKNGASASQPISIIGYRTNGFSKPVLNSAGNTNCIRINNCKYIEIKNFDVVAAGNYGIRVYRATNLKLENLRIHNNGDNNLWINISDSITVTRNTNFNSPNFGIKVLNASNVKISKSSIYGNNYSGINVEGTCPGVIIESNDVSYNRERGIHLLNTTNIRLLNNKVYSNRYSGITLEGGNRHYLYQNIAHNNRERGIQVLNSPNVKMNGDICYSNQSSGIILEGTSDNGIINGIICYRNNERGIQLQTDNNKIFKCLTYKNGWSGIIIEGGADNCVIQNCTCYSNLNGNHGIQAQNSTVIIKDYIGWGNTGLDIANESGADITVTYCDINSWTTGSPQVILGDGCLPNVNPLFKSTADFAEDFHLIWNSPAAQSAGSTNDILANCMGAFPIYFIPRNSATGSTFAQRIFLTTDISNGSVPGNGIIKIIYPIEIDITGVTGVSTESTWGGTPGSFIPSVSGQTLTITRSGGTSSLPGKTENLVISSIRGNSEGEYSIILDISSNSGALIDRETSNDFRIQNPTIYYVSKYTNSPDPPYATPQTAATQIYDVVNIMGDNSVIKIIDNWTNYKSFSLNNFKDITVTGSNYNPTVNATNQDLGVLVNASSNIWIDNITFKNANWNAIRFWNSGNSRATRNTCHANRERGIMVYNSQNVKVENNIVRKSGWSGIFFESVCNNSSASNNICYSNIRDGIRTEANNITIVSNICYRNNERGIHTINVSGIKITGNNVYRNNWTGITIEGGGNNVLNGNISYRNTERGIQLLNSSDCRLNSDICYSNSQSGIILEGTANNSVINSITSYRNNERGIQLLTDNNTLFNCVTYKNGWSGIIVEGTADNCLIQNCTSYSNLGGNHGLEIANNTVTIKNAITASNSGLGISSSDNITVTYCDINDGYSTPQVTLGTGCITSDPFFISQKPFQEDFHLRWNSPAIGTGGTNTIATNSIGAFPYYVKPSNIYTGDNAFYRISFTSAFTDGSIPSDGKIDIVFPAGFNLTGITSVTSTSRWGGTKGIFSPSVAGQTVTVTRSGGTKSKGGETEDLIISTIGNASVSTTYQLNIITKKATGEIIENMTTHQFRLIFGFRLVSTYPTNNAIQIPFNTIITGRFNSALKKSTVSNNFYLLNSEYNRVQLSSVSIPQSNIAVLTPSFDLYPNEFYTIIATTNIKNTNNLNLVNSYYKYFRTAPGTETVHQYRTNALDSNLTGWDNSNNVTYDNTLGERLATDGADDSVATSVTTNLWFTWNTNRLTFALVKKNGGAVSSNWHDYIAIDVTRDNKGATNFPGDGVTPTMSFRYNRLPEFILKLDHNRFGNGWDEAGSSFSVLQKWTGTSWVNWGTAGVAGDYWFPNIANSQVIEGWIKFNIITNKGRIPNRIAIASWSAEAGSVTDFCPEKPNGTIVTNFITIDPDNNDDEIPDRATAGPPPTTTLAITKSVSNIKLGASNSSPIPGATIIYRIIYSNTGSISASNSIIFDSVPTNTTYATSYLGTATLWTVQWSTNLNPNQMWNSSNYINVQPFPKDLIRWVRWRKKNVPVDEDGKTIFFEVIIK